MADTIKYDVLNRYSGEVQFTAEIECSSDALPSMKLGLAVKWGFKTRANLAGANLDGANLARANLAGAYLARAYLAKANLDGANLARANLAGANLDGANLAGAYLARAYLARANLDGANLARANLAGANLDGANLAGANLAGAYLDKEKIVSIAGRATRNDGYEFILFALENTEHIIRAGCRTFTLEQFRAHVAREYPDTEKARETLDILAFLETRLAAALEKGAV